MSAPANAEDDEVIVHKIAAALGTMKEGQYALVGSPSMRLHEVGTRFLNRLAQTSDSRDSWRNNAYSLAYWYTYCSAAGVDPRYASVDDLTDYKNVQEKTLSLRTGKPLESGTIAQRLIPVIQHYADEATNEWYFGSISEEAKLTRTHTIPVAVDAMAHTRSGNRITRAASKLIPKRQSSGSYIRPFAIRELRALLEGLGPTAAGRNKEDHRPIRDRLIVDYGWAVGLRIKELMGLRFHQFLTLTPDPNAPWEHSTIEILGKGKKWRSVLVPNWLIQDTLVYIEGERAECLKAGGVARQGAPSALFVSGMNSSRPGRPFTPRRVQGILEAACIKAGLVRLVERTDQTGLVSVVQKPLHCVHDLRHTYAVLTYWAEVRAGNPEPWKKIQSQLGHESMETTKSIYLKHVNGHNEFGTASVRDLIGLSRGAHGA